MGRSGLRELQEGRIKFRVPQGEVSKSSEVFYNPVMEFPRDLSIAVYGALFDEASFLDALGASGVRGLRVAEELGWKVMVNDVNPQAADLIEKNAELNGLGVGVSNKHANSVMSEDFFDVVDVDPFGTPVPFLDSAVRSARKLLSVTATDTAVLCGSYPSTCWRRYLARNRRTDFLHELGVRILAGYVVRMGARFDVSLTPVFAHSRLHYYRVYFRISKGARECNKLLDKVSVFFWNPESLERSEEEKKGFVKLGPVWKDGLWSESLLDDLGDEIRNGCFNTRDELWDLLNLLKDEAGLPPFYYDVHQVCKCMSLEVPAFKNIGEGLSELGVDWSRTHFTPTGIRADCKVSELKKVIKSVSE